MTVPRRILGRTGLHVSCLSFGAGPVSGLMTGLDAALQFKTIRMLADMGINWIDTAAGYGNGTSERNVGIVLSALPCALREKIHAATKVRIDLSSSVSFADQVKFSLDESLKRLRCSRVSLLQLHNSITDERGDQPDSLGIADVLSSGGILDQLASLKELGKVGFIGLTGTGAVRATREVVSTGGFDTIQVPYNLANPSAGCEVDQDFGEQNYGNLLQLCSEMHMGCFAIRVFAGGALLGQPPSQHTLKTKYFPLDLYQRDLQRAADLGVATTAKGSIQSCIEFSLSHPGIHSAIIGFGGPAHVLDAVKAIGCSSQS